MAAHEVGIGFGVDLEQVCGIPLYSFDARSDPGVTGSTVQRGQRIKAGVDDRDVMAKLGQWNGQTAGATAKVDDAQTSPELLLAIDRKSPNRLPDR
jgi:hypothetical protein